MGLSTYDDRPKADTRVLRFDKKTAPAVRLFAFPHAGAGAVAYHGWHNEMPAPVELVAVQYPGRGARSREPLCRRVETLVADSVRAVRAYGDVPFALFGHSLGALVAFEVCRALRRDGGPLPAALFISAVGAPTGLRSTTAAHRLPDAELLRYVERLGGMQPEILHNAQMMALLLPLIRADLEVLETWDYLPGPALPMPIVAFGGQDDPTVSASGLQAWAQATTASFRLRLLPGDHFFLTGHRTAVIGDITATLRGAGFTI